MVANLQAGRKEKYYYKCKWCFHTSIDLPTTDSIYRLDEEFAYVQCVFIVFSVMVIKPSMLCPQVDFI